MCTPLWLGDTGPAQFSAPLAQQSSLQRAESRAWKDESPTKTEKAVFWKAIVLLLWVGIAGGRWGKAGACHPSPSVVTPAQ